GPAPPAGVRGGRRRERGGRCRPPPRRLGGAPHGRARAAGRVGSRRRALRARDPRRARGRSRGHELGEGVVGPGGGAPGALSALPKHRERGAAGRPRGGRALHHSNLLGSAPWGVLLGGGFDGARGAPRRSQGRAVEDALSHGAGVPDDGGLDRGGPSSHEERVMKGLVQSRAVPRRGGATRRAHPGGGPRSWFVWAGAGLLGACAASPGGVSPEPAPPLPVRFSVAPAAPELPSSIATREESAGPETAPPGPFEGRESVTYGEFIEELRRVADELADTPEVRRGYERLLSEYQLTSADVSPQTYSRVRLVFEATRDGGFWGIRWDITDRMPWSDAIWEQWRAHDWTKEEEAATSPLSVETDTTPGRAASRDDAASEAARETTPREVIPRAAAPREVTSPTAVAECDELSALFALLARDLEIDGFVGLFWPT